MVDEDHVVSGRYRLVERVGSGAMGVVWRAHDEVLGRTVAVKQLTLPTGPTTESGREARERARREARIAARVRHPNAVTLFDVVEDDGLPWLVMEYVRSRSLAAVVADSGPLPPREVARIGTLVASALSAAHEVGVVHRDVKPGNVLLGDGGVVKIADFGISRAVDDVVLTSTGIIAGTPAYLSPEMARGAEPTAPSDVFALGSTLYAAVEGEPPFGLSDSALAVLHAVASGRIRVPTRAGPLEQCLMLLLASDPDERPSMVEAELLLASVADGTPPPVLDRKPTRRATAGAQRTELARPLEPTARIRAADRTALQRPEDGGDRPLGGVAAGGVAAGGAASTGGKPGGGGPRGGLTGGPVAGGTSKSKPARRRPTVRTTVALVAAVAVVVTGVVLGSAALSKGTDHSPSQVAAGRGDPAGSDGQTDGTTQASTPGSTAGGTPDAEDGPESDRPPARPSASPPHPPAKTKPTRQEMQDFISNYYALLPDQQAAAWNELSPRYQAQAGGFESYQGFWNTIASVRTGAVKATGPHTVTAVLTFTKRNGTVSVEHYHFTTSVVGGRLLIDDAGIAGR